MAWIRAENVDASEPRDVEFATVVKVPQLSTLGRFKLGSKSYVISVNVAKILKPCRRASNTAQSIIFKGLLVIDTSSGHHAQRVPDADAQCLTSNQMSINSLQ